MTQKKELKQIPANRRLVEELYSYGEIDKEARDYALNFLYPHKQLRLWISNLLLVLGVALLLSGIVYFFAFNWAEMSNLLKLTSIQVGIVGCVIGAYFYSLKRIEGQLLLFSASLLVGVFMAVFGQIYQTGADAYQLFMTWSILILGWTIISKFPAQWVLWLIIANIFIILWWEEFLQPSRSVSLIIFAYLTLFNGTALVVYEYFAKKKLYEWLNVRWLKILLVIMVLTYMMFPISGLILEDSKQHIPALVIGSVIALIGYVVMYLFYRYKRPDIIILVCWVVSVCTIVEILIFKTLSHSSSSELILFFVGAILTLAVFSSAVILLRKTAKKMEMSND